MADITPEDFAELQEQKKTLIEEYNNLSEQLGVKKAELIELQGQEKYMLKKDPSLKPE
tara:strand:- start:236 stop:409 length:174 start_codon:yes stop_codon:yes gene_type:complete